MALNPAVKALLDSAGLESNLDDVPAKFEDTEQVVGPEDVFSSFDTTALLDAAGEAGFGLANTAGEDGLLPFWGEEVKDAVGLAIVGAAKDDGSSAKVRHGRPRGMGGRRTERWGLER